MAGNSHFSVLLAVEADRDKETILNWYETVRIDEDDQVIIILGVLHQRQDRNEILRRINLIE
jgi:hypothetical protein